MLKGIVLQAVEKLRLATQDLAVPAVLSVRTLQSRLPGTDPIYSNVNSAITIVNSEFTFDEIDGDRIRATDRKVLVFPPAVPVPNDLIIESGVSYRILANEQVKAGDTTALSVIHMRQM